MNAIKSNRGFTLVELMVVCVIASFIVMAVTIVFRAQNRSYLFQEQTTATQQNLRAATYIMSDELRMVGTSITAAGDGSAGNPFRFTAIADNDNQDNDNDGATDENGEIKDVLYQLFDDQGDGDMELGRQDINSANPMSAIAENIQTLGLAYAYDGNDDGRADTYDVDTDGDGFGDTPFTIWAVPNAANRWANLDLNNDGQINDDDSPNPGVRITEPLAGISTGVTVDLDAICGIKIWLLSVSNPLDADNASKYVNNHVYVVGNQKVFPNDNLIRRIQSINVKFRNMGL